MDKERLVSWINGKLEDEALTDKELKWLEKKTLKAAVRKIDELIAAGGPMVFSQHATLQ